MHKRRPVPWWLVVSAQYSGGRTTGRGIFSHPMHTITPLLNPCHMKLRNHKPILGYWSLSQRSTAIFFILGQRWGNHCVEIREDGFGCPGGQIWFQQSGKGSPCPAERFPPGPAVPPAGCVQKTTYWGTSSKTLYSIVCGSSNLMGLLKKEHLSQPYHHSYLLFCTTGVTCVRLIFLHLLWICNLKDFFPLGLVCKLYHITSKLLQ